VNSRDRLRAALGGAAAGLAGGLFGVGGGVLLVPILTGAFRLGQHRAHGTSLAVIVLTVLAAVPVYAGHGNVSWITALVVGLASIATAPAGAHLAGQLSNAALSRAFAVFLLLVAARLLWAPEPMPVVRAFHDLHRVPSDVAIGALVGLLAGFLGVGGGILAVPAFTLALGMPQQLAQGTSLVVILAAASSGTIANFRTRNVEWPLVPALAAGAMIAAPLASWAVQGVPHEWLVRGFAVFLVGNAVHGWLRTR
jgi:uncharacterized membrane protein YfcA